MIGTRLGRSMYIKIQKAFAFESVLAREARFFPERMGVAGHQPLFNSSSHVPPGQ